MVSNLKGLFAVVGLGDEQVVGINAELLRIRAVEGVSGVYERREASALLCLGDAMHRQRCLTRRFRPVDLGHTAARNTANAEGQIKPQRPRRNERYVHYLFITEFHNGTL